MSQKQAHSLVAGWPWLVAFISRRSSDYGTAAELDQMLFQSYPPFPHASAATLPWFYISSQRCSVHHLYHLPQIHHNDCTDRRSESARSCCKCLLPDPLSATPGLRWNAGCTRSSIPSAASGLVLWFTSSGGDTSRGNTRDNSPA